MDDGFAVVTFTFDFNLTATPFAVQGSLTQFLIFEFDFDIFEGLLDFHDIECVRIKTAPKLGEGFFEM